VIVTPDSKLASAITVVGLAVTTRLDTCDPNRSVNLPWHPRGQAGTKLRKPSAVVCDWFVELNPAGLVAEGHVPGDRLQKILEVMRANLPKDIQEP
jgi:hypothetical protein